MPIYLILVQLLLPILLLLWLAMLVQKRWTIFWIQFILTAIIVFALSVLTPWAIPPWWTPYCFAAVLLTIGVFRIGKMCKKHHQWTVDKLSWMTVLPLAPIAIFGALQSEEAIRGHRQPFGESVDISSPFLSGDFIVENGGATLAVNGHLHTLDPADPLHETARGQSKAIDIIAINGWGFRSSGFWPPDPQRYVGFGLPIIAPCDGNVVQATNDVEDQQVPRLNLDQPSGNQVAIDCGTFLIVLAHLQSGSVNHREGDKIELGEMVGRIGNSGASTEPHLHIHAERRNGDSDAFEGDPLWLTINGRFLARNDQYIASP